MGTGQTYGALAVVLAGYGRDVRLIKPSDEGRVKECGLRGVARPETGVKSATSVSTQA